ncbi:M23 family metallopeptidase [Paenibacillus sp. IHBB 10380]|uniref:M23 family metallopeptidase n=1 Tax=Paenibacillus sp. IHBB 10380 TaxID=1566358 RepID=UPI0005CFC288|nr:M23 family metallopeptidase [Paenibacillus sp. IHBB 10380]AJS60398.1 membrane protein [Paenibacillus sp. IHBB 10380]
MNEKNKNQPQGDTPKYQGGTASKPSSWKSLLSKRWVYPAVYMAAAAIILTLVWVYQDTSQKALIPDPTKVSENAGLTTKSGVDAVDQEAVEVIAKSESIGWPVAVATEVDIVKPYYDPKGTAENHQEAMVQYNETFEPNIGVDLARGDNKTFEVKAALSGKVTRVEAPTILGTVVELTHPNNMRTVYQSLTDAKVKLGDEVKQGDTLAMAGRSEIEKDLGNHLHFEVYDNGNLVNPAEIFPSK